MDDNASPHPVGDPKRIGAVLPEVLELLRSNQTERARALMAAVLRDEAHGSVEPTEQS